MSTDKEEISTDEITKKKGFLIYIDQDHINEMRSLFQAGQPQKEQPRESEFMELEQPKEEKEIGRRFGCNGGLSVFCGTVGH